MTARDEERDELFNLWAEHGASFESDSSEGKELAEAILDAGYFRPSTVTAVEELDALGAKSVILDRNGTPWVCDGDEVSPWASICEDPHGGPVWIDSLDIPLPAKILHEGGVL